MHGATDVDDGGESGTESAEGDGRVGRGIGEVPVVVQEDGELELGDEGLGEGDGGEAERDIELQRRRDAEFGEWAPSRTGGVVRGGERAEGVGGSGGARRAHHLRLAPAWRERSQEDTLQVGPTNTTICFLKVSTVMIFLIYSM